MNNNFLLAVVYPEPKFPTYFRPLSIITYIMVCVKSTIEMKVIRQNGVPPQQLVGISLVCTEVISSKWIKHDHYKYKGRL